MSDPRYKRPESVLVVVCARSGEVLMLRRRTPADFWQSVTGSLEWGETAQAAARRELAEETGLSPAADPVASGETNRFAILPQWRPRYAPGERYNTEYVFHLVLDRPCQVELNPQEHLEYRWLPWPQAAEMASSHTNRDAILALGPDLDSDGAAP